MNGHVTTHRKGRLSRRAMIAALLTIASALAAFTNVAAQPTPIDPLTIPKFVEPLPMPLRVSVTRTSAKAPLEISMNEFQQQLLPASFYAGLPAPYNAGAYLWCYKAKGYPQTFPGPTLEARVGTPTTIKYVNNLVGPGGAPPVLQSLIQIDQTIHWADPLGSTVNGSPAPGSPYSGPVPAVAHLHGGEVPSAFDGGPNAWWTPGMAQKGSSYVTDTYTYPNKQEATTLWYHDHTMGATRINVYAGLAGFYLLRDPFREALLPGGPIDRPKDMYGNPYEREIVIQDRMFDTNGQLFWPTEATNPEVHPLWSPEFFGDVIMVNGKTWPYLQVEPRRYRFRFLDGSNARFYTLRLVDDATGAAGPILWQVGSDGGLLESPVALNDPAAVTPLPMLISPGERMDVIVDFSNFKGKTLTMMNTANGPYPAGDPVDANTTALIMQVRVGTTISGRYDVSLNPAKFKYLRLPIERPNNPTATRALTLNENMGEGGPLEMFVNNSMFDMTPTENMAIGSTESWEIINLTADTHPIHLHLLQYQIVSRQAFDVNGYMSVYGMPMPGMGPPMPYDAMNAATGNKLGGNPDVTPFLLGPVLAPDANETGWKDTFRMNPGEVTRVMVRAAPQDANQKSRGRLAAGMNLFAFDPTAAPGTKDKFGYPGGPGYVWHCHIVDHEDNEMMRRFMMVNPAAGVPGPVAGPCVTTPETDEVRALPAEVSLAAAKPNPAIGTTRIGFSLPSAGSVQLTVFDLAGREVAQLADGQYAAGEHVIQWAGQDRAGRPLPSGAYMYRLRTPNQNFVRKLVLIH